MTRPRGLRAPGARGGLAVAFVAGLRGARPPSRTLRRAVLRVGRRRDDELRHLLRVDRRGSRAASSRSDTGVPSNGVNPSGQRERDAAERTSASPAANRGITGASITAMRVEGLPEVVEERLRSPARPASPRACCPAPPCSRRRRGRSRRGSPRGTRGRGRPPGRPRARRRTALRSSCRVPPAAAPPRVPPSFAMGRVDARGEVRDPLLEVGVDRGSGTPRATGRCRRCPARGSTA